MQHPHVLLVGATGLLGHQGVIGDPKGGRREELVAEAILGKGAGRAHERPDQVAIINVGAKAPVQAGEGQAQGAADVQFARFGPYTHDQGHAYQARGHRVGVVQHADSTEAGDGDWQLATGMERGGGQGAQGVQFGRSAQLASLVARAGQLVEPGDVAGAVGKGTVPPRPERLVHGLLEAVVGLLDIAVLVGFADGIGGRRHAVVGHQGQIAIRPAALAVGLDGLNRRREIVGAVVLWYATDLPETELQPLGEGLKALPNNGRSVAGYSSDRIL